MNQPIKHFVEWIVVTTGLLLITLIAFCIPVAFVTMSIPEISWLFLTESGRGLIIFEVVMAGGFVWCYKSEQRHLLWEAWDNNY